MNYSSIEHQNSLTLHWRLTKLPCGTHRHHCIYSQPNKQLHFIFYVLLPAPASFHKVFHLFLIDRQDILSRYQTLLQMIENKSFLTLTCPFLTHLVFLAPFNEIRVSWQMIPEKNEENEEKSDHLSKRIIHQNQRNVSCGILQCGW